MELTDALKSLCIETAKALKGSARRLFMARTVQELGAPTNWRAVLFASMPLRHAGANVWKSLSRTCCPTSKPLSIVKVKPTRSFVPTVCLPV